MKKYKEIAYCISIMEAEFMTCFETTNQSLWLQNFILELGIIDTVVRPEDIMW